MKQRVLVTYATRTGSTVDVAAAVGETLSTAGFAVDVKPIKENPQIDGYQAVLIGSAVNRGNWLPEAVEFVKTNREALGRVQVALFTVHIQNLGDDEKSRNNRLAYLNAIRPLIRPVAEVFFAGRFDRHGAALLLPGWVPGSIAGVVPTYDLRDWKKIRAWAGDLKDMLAA